MRFLIADDHAVMRLGLKQLLLEEFPSAIVDEAEDAETVLNKSMHLKWDVVISDISMPGRSGLEVLKYFKENAADTPVLVLSIHPEEQYAVRTLKAGAAGYLTKNAAPQELIKAVHRLLLGRKYISSSIAEKLVGELETPELKSPHELLSDREFEVLKMLASGKTVSVISESLLLSVTTVSTYRSRILAKMNMKTNSDLTRYAVNNNLL